MNPKDATGIRNNSVLILLLSGALLVIGLRVIDPPIYLMWLPFSLALFGTIIVLSRYQHAD